MKKLIAILAAGILACCAFAGCGEAADSNKETTAPETTAAVETTVAPTTEAPKATPDEAEKADITGAWVVGAFNRDGKDYSVPEYAELVGVDSDSLLIVYTFDAEGKTTCTMAGVTVEGTYTFDGTNVQTTFENASPAFKYDENNDSLFVNDENTGVTTLLVRGEAEENGSEETAEE